jgi:ligand-binding SRPBCC domain-containing protein
MGRNSLSRSLELALPRDRVFAFFADAANLERITPPELRFHIVTPQPFEIRKGTLIDYKLSLRGFPMKWRTEISDWEPPVKFVDRQLRGPYREWIHTHTFTELSPQRTLIEDQVTYSLPMSPLTDMFHFLVRRELNYIFDYRQAEVERILTKEAL